MKSYAIGIDPGVATGFAVWNCRSKSFETVTSMSLPAAFNTILQAFYPDDTVIHIEDARMRTWYGNKGREVAQGVGSVKRDCTIWEEFCKFHGIEYQLHHPKNNTTKLKAPEFKAYTQWDKQTNEHGRDAAMIVFGK